MLNVPEQKLPGKSDLCPGCGWSEKKVFQSSVQLFNYVQGPAVDLTPPNSAGVKLGRVRVPHKPDTPTRPHPHDYWTFFSPHLRRLLHRKCLFI